MRTTVELPPDLMRAAKARSAERGESLKSLLARAVEAELQMHQRQAPKGRVTLPLFGGAGPAVRVSNADLERALAAADADATPKARVRRRHRRTSR